VKQQALLMAVHLLPLQCLHARSLSLLLSWLLAAGCHCQAYQLFV
jgi:hypothetical protein